MTKLEALQEAIKTRKERRDHQDKLDKEYWVLDDAKTLAQSAYEDAHSDYLKVLKEYEESLGE